MAEQSPDYDSPWKEVLEEFFPDFIAFWFPEAESDIDWAKGYQFLDKELQQITHDATTGRKYVDKLVRVWRNKGTEEWVLIHVEVQTGQEKDFAERMYIYNNRIYDKYRKQVVSFAVLADDGRSWRPDRFEYSLWNCRVVLEFPIVKLIDWAQRIDEIQKSGNVFGIITAAHLRTLETRRDATGRFRWKISIMQSLYDAGFGEQQIRKLFRFIDWVMLLPHEMNQQFYRTMETFEEAGNRPFITSWERIGLEKGMKEGMKEGIKQIQELLLDSLRIRFGSVSPNVSEKLSRIFSVEELRELHRTALTAETFEQFLEYLDNVDEGQQSDI